uniref:Neur_chan_LBD domain-containing protein n=1 Tax=Taenia asiatica TaxID=60517 RepID=A0A0R3W361_TAEAS
LFGNPCCRGNVELYLDFSVTFVNMLTTWSAGGRIRYLNLILKIQQNGATYPMV